MKSIVFFFIVALIMGFPASSSAQGENADTMIHKIFRALKNKDEISFLKLFPNVEQFKTHLINQYKKSRSDTTYGLFIEIRNMTAEDYKDFEKEYIRNFKTILREGERRGIKWGEVKLLSYHFHESDIKQNEIPYLNGTIFMVSNGDKYFMNFRNMHKMDGFDGWFGIIIENILKEGERIEDYNEVIEIGGEDQ